MDDDHDCLECLEFKQADWVETHGLDCGPYEQWHEEWWECTLCAERFTGRELDELARETES